MAPAKRLPSVARPLMLMSLGPQEVPEAAALLATDANAARDVPQLAALAYWAPSRLLQATALLAGAAGSHQAVRAYALRSLTTMATPEEVRLSCRPGFDTRSEHFVIVSRPCLVPGMKRCTFKT